MSPGVKGVLSLAHFLKEYSSSTICSIWLWKVYLKKSTIFGLVLILVIYLFWSINTKIRNLSAESCYIVVTEWLFYPGRKDIGYSCRLFQENWNTCASLKLFALWVRNIIIKLFTGHFLTAFQVFWPTGDLYISTDFYKGGV